MFLIDDDEEPVLQCRQFEFDTIRTFRDIFQLSGSHERPGSLHSSLGGEPVQVYCQSQLPHGQLRESLYFSPSAVPACIASFWGTKGVRRNQDLQTVQVDRMSEAISVDNMCDLERLHEHGA
jgi:hypothetical protein